MLEKINNAANYLQNRLDFKPEVALILGSGLGVLAEEIENSIKINYEDVPGFPLSTVEGHVNRFVAGLLSGKKVLAMQGRFHYYEGYSMQEVTLPIRVMGEMGIDKLIITNAAGGVNRLFDPGDLMLIADHINLMGVNPLRGANLDKYGPRFPDMSSAYNKDLIELAETVAKEKGLLLRKGVYAAVSGPTYETPAEVRSARNSGADAVGMSTVPEVIVANHMGIDVLGISCITNMAAGILSQPLDHSEVVENAEQVKPEFKKLVKGVLHNI